MVIDNDLFSLFILKTDLVASKQDNASNHLPSSIKFKGGEKENAFVCLFILKSNVSCGFVFVCSINVSVCFF